MSPVTTTKPARKTKPAPGVTPNGDPIPEFVQKQIDRNESAAGKKKSRRVDRAHKSSTAAETDENISTEMRLQSIPVSLIAVTENDRQTFDPAALQRLADSIRPTKNHFARFAKSSQPPRPLGRPKSQRLPAAKKRSRWKRPPPIRSTRPICGTRSRETCCRCWRQHCSRSNTQRLCRWCTSTSA